MKGDLGPVVDVRSPGYGAACGFEVPVGGRVGVFLRTGDELPTGGLCTTVDADVLLTVVEPRPSGTGPPRLLVAGPFHDGSIGVVDADGGLLDVLEEPVDPVHAWARCPEGDLAAELRPWSVTLRDLADLDVVDSVDLRGFADEVALTGVVCRAGGETWLVGERWDGERSIVGAWSVASGRPPRLLLEIDEGRWLDAGSTIGVVGDLATARVSILRWDDPRPMLLHERRRGADDHFAGIADAAISPDGSRIAVLDVRYPVDGAPSGTLVLYDVAGKELARRSYDLEVATVTWLDTDVLAVTFHVDPAARLDLVGADDLAPIASWDPWPAHATVLLDGSPVGISRGHLYRGMGDGTVEELGVLPGLSSGPLLVLPPRADEPAVGPTTLPTFDAPSPAPPTAPSTDASTNALPVLIVLLLVTLGLTAGTLVVAGRR